MSRLKFEAALLIAAALAIVVVSVLLIHFTFLRLIKPEMALLVSSILQILTSILLISVILKQTEIADKQTKLFELEKNRILMFVHIVHLSLRLNIGTMTYIIYLKFI